LPSYVVTAMSISPFDNFCYALTLIIFTTIKRGVTNQK